MKTKKIQMGLVSICILILLACEKITPLDDPNSATPVKMDIKGLVLTDTLEFVLDNVVIGQAIESQFSISDRLYSPGKKIQIRKKTGKTVVGEIEIEEEPRNQVKKIFYDGTTFTDKIDLTPVSNPDNMGVRMKFSSSSKLFYGGPVDVKFMIQEIDMNTFSFSYVNTDLIFKNVTSSFGDFHEVPPLVSDDTTLRQYVVVVHKAGTNEAPYKNGIELGGYPDPNVVLGNLDTFTAGESVLLSIADTFASETLLDSYRIEDLSTPFK